jgi:hypothetical protein
MINMPEQSTESMYRKLDTTFTHDGFSYKQLSRTGNVAIYEQSKTYMKMPIYEVVVIRQMRGRTSGLFKIVPHEKYPSNEEWGKYGWTLPTLEGAKEKMEELIEAHRNR